MLVIEKKAVFNRILELPNTFLSSIWHQATAEMWLRKKSDKLMSLAHKSRSFRTLLMSFIRQRSRRPQSCWFGHPGPGQLGRGAQGPQQLCCWHTGDGPPVLTLPPWQNRSQSGHAANPFCKGSSECGEWNLYFWTLPLIYMLQVTIFTINLPHLCPVCWMGEF